MSRGPGKWQRAVMAALEQVPAFYPMDLLPAEHSRSDVVALNRPVRSLGKAGRTDSGPTMPPFPYCPSTVRVAFIANCPLCNT